MPFPSCKCNLSVPFVVLLLGMCDLTTAGRGARQAAAGAGAESERAGPLLERARRGRQGPAGPGPGGARGERPRRDRGAVPVLLAAHARQLAEAARGVGAKRRPLGPRHAKPILRPAAAAAAATAGSKAAPGLVRPAAAAQVCWPRTFVGALVGAAASAPGSVRRGRRRRPAAGGGQRGGLRERPQRRRRRGRAPGNATLESNGQVRTVRKLLLAAAAVNAPR